MLFSQARWLSDVISPEQASELTAFREIKVTRVPSSSICLLCKGGRMLCGKFHCPIIAKAQSLARSSLRITSPRIQGSTPPGVFVGRIGYPKVYIGPMVPPFRGDTEILDTPELWVGKGIQDIIDYRFALIRGKVRASVSDARTGGRLLDSLQELAMGKRSVDAEAVLTRVPHKVITLSGETQPFGPSAPLRSFTASEVSVDHRIEDAFYDRDLKSADAVVGLYDDDVLVTRIQRAFSLGMFGTAKRRKLVPTRWSITAVDSILSQELIDRIKEHDTIDEYRVYSYEHLGNKFVAVLMPELWSFDWIECWFPGTAWNPGERDIAMMGDWEPYSGRKTYPDIGGCYFACRLAVAEKLHAEGKQASALITREIYPDYIMPLGVWLTRESVRNMLRTEPRKFDNLQNALKYAASLLTVPMIKWIKSSSLLQRALFQKKITAF
jgi:hypothetical protein